MKDRTNEPVAGCSPGEKTDESQGWLHIGKPLNGVTNTIFASATDA